MEVQFTNNINTLINYLLQYNLGRLLIKKMNDKKLHRTMHIKNSDFTEYYGGVAHIGLRQICDLTNLKGCKFGSLSYRSEIALYFATFSYANR